MGIMQKLFQFNLENFQNWYSLF